MKISNSKKQLAKIISENVGWVNAAGFAAQDQNAAVTFFVDKPWRCGAVWECENFEAVGGFGVTEAALPNWHQTILSREEYFHLYPAPDADGWILWNGGECPVAGLSVVDVKYFDVEGFVTGISLDFVWGPKTNIVYYRKTRSESEQATQEPKQVPVPESKPTIEQLASDYRNAKDYAERKRDEADAAKADAEAKLAELVAAGKALGLVLSVADPEPELVITDWRELLPGDIIRTAPYPDDVAVKNSPWPGGWARSNIDKEFSVLRIRDDGAISIDSDKPMEPIEETDIGVAFKFIRRP